MAHKYGSFYGRKAPKRARKVRTSGELTPGAPRFHTGSFVNTGNAGEALKYVGKRADLNPRAPRGNRPVTVREFDAPARLPITEIRKRGNDRTNYSAFLLNVSAKDPR